MRDHSEFFEDISNPLDCVEEVLSNQDWSFERPDENELSINIAGKRGIYNVTFLWDEDNSAMRFACHYDLHIPSKHMEAASRAILEVNSHLWLGHFTVSGKNNTPVFVHTSLFRGMSQTSGADHIEELMDTALSECEQHYQIFSLLADSSSVHDGLLNLVLMQSAGEA